MLLDRMSGKKTVILDIEELSFVPHFLPVYTELKKRTDRISFYIATHYPGNPELNVFEVPRGKQFDVSLSRKLKADAFISAHIYGVGHPSSYKIHINHNQPVKYEAYQKRDFVNFDAHFLTSPLHREQTENSIAKYGLNERSIDLFDIGYSKSDKLLRGDYTKEQVLKELGLPLRKTVLYAPSWDEGLSLRTQGKEIISKLLKIEGINVIVKLHPISYCNPEGPNFQFYTGGTDWISELSEFESHEKFRHIPAMQIDPMLAASDVMVTDVSSVALEFIMLNKPVIYIDCPEFYEKTLAKTYSGFGDTDAEFVKNDPKANAGRHTGDVVYEPGGLIPAVVKAIDDPGRNSAKRLELIPKLSYNPGRAAEVSAETVIRILGI